jgi:ABC-type nitrate/sulfonate/bicarbonate transport system substrate-binding protein
VDRLLRALYRAETFAGTNPEAAERIIADATGSEAAFTGMREPLTHELSLKQSLLLATENQVDWYFRRGLIPPGPSPDVLNAFEPGPLRSIKPSDVTIVK